jgi:CRISPR-associated RAMP protein (TIGR02581 family)
MLKKLVNEAFFTLRITTTGPLLIKSSFATVSGPDMAPVRTSRNGKQEVFLPGSSLKGVFRSHIEKITCGLKPQVVCYPFSVRENREVDQAPRRHDFRESCGEAFQKLSRDYKGLEDNTDYVYAHSCPTCRLFGSTWFIGRVAIGDAYLARNTVEVKEQRDGVGIDRLTGGSSHSAKFDLEVVSAGVSFETDIHLRNFEIWQLGMLFAVIQDMEDELIRLGSGRSRGLGSVTAEIIDKEKFGHEGGVILTSMRGSSEPDGELWGLGRWLNDGSYGTSREDFLRLPEPAEHRDRGIRRTRAFTGDAISRLQTEAINQFVTRMQGWEQPPIGLAHARNA